MVGDFRTTVWRCWPSSVAQLTRSERRLFIKHIESIADDQHGVISRAQIREAGLSRWDVRNQIEAGRWRRLGPRTIAVHQGDLPERGRWWHAVLEAGPQAALDGVTALQAAGLTGFDDPICVSLPYGERPRSRPAGVRIKVTRRRTEGDVMGAGIPRVRPNIAAIRGALWAPADRQAAFIVVLAAQQRLTTPRALVEAHQAVTRHKRRGLLGDILADITDGVRAMGELDFARLCRVYGIPEPSRQVVRKGRNGKVYLDVYWDELGVVVEVEGIHHTIGLTPIDDALRQNELTLSSDVVLRLPVLGLRLMPDTFMQQIQRRLRQQ